MTQNTTAAAASGAADNCTILPDGSAFAVGSFPLPQDHWLYAPHEYEPGADEPKELLAPILTHAQRNEVVAAVRYAVRGATMCSKDPDFDPDALVQNAVYALCGSFGRTALATTAQPAPQQEAQEPVAVVVPCHTPSGKRVALYSAKQDLPIGTQLYTAPQPSPAAQGDVLDAALLDWLDENIFWREMGEWDAKYGHGDGYNTWVLFAPKGVQGKVPVRSSALPAQHRRVGTMTEPTDEELLDCARGKSGHIDFARAVLAKWGTPAPVGVEPVAWAATSEDGDVKALGMNQSCRFDTPLYTAAQAQTVAMSVADEEIQPIVRNSEAPGDLKLGDYVFASRWSDCDPGDPWAVGFVSEVGSYLKSVTKAGYIVLRGGSRRWGRAMRITQEQGRRICEQFPAMERLPTDYKAIARVFGIKGGQHGTDA